MRRDSAARSVRVALRAPLALDFALTARVLRRSTRNLVDRVDDDGTWSRLVELSRGPALLRGRQHGAKVVFEAIPADPADVRTIKALVTRLFSLELDLAPFWRRVRREPGFAELAQRCAGLRPQRFATLFEALVNGICCQQLSLASGLTRLGYLAERFGPRTPDGSRAGSPDPVRLAAASIPMLRQAGLPARRAAELRDLARLPLALFERELNSLPDEAARARLLELPGIGPWTADYVLLRGLGRLDVFPSGDVGAANTLGRILDRAIDPQRTVKIAARFAPFRGMLYFSMLGYTLASSSRNDSTHPEVQTPSDKEKA